VKHKHTVDSLTKFLGKQGLYISVTQKMKMVTFHELLVKWSRKINIVSSADVSNIVERHFLPSLFLNYIVHKNGSGSMLDIGSGSGFPGVILGIMQPEQDLVLLDSSQKKCLFLKEVKEALNLSFKVVCQRVEEYNIKHKIIVCRAVATLEKIWKWSINILEKEGSLFALKGTNCGKEIDLLKQENVIIETIVPPKEWLIFSDYLKDKQILKCSME